MEGDNVVSISIMHVRLAGGALEMVAEADRPIGANVLHELSQRALAGAMTVWYEKWHTLSVELIDGICTRTKDEWFPPSISELLMPDYKSVPFFDIVNLKFLHQFTNSVYRVQILEFVVTPMQAIFKTCPVAEELRGFAHEIEVYNKLRKRKKFNEVPELYAYVFEGTKEHTIGFLCIDIEDARHAIQINYRLCKAALARLHSRGVVHGDLKLENILVSDIMGVRFVDLANASFDDKTMQDGEFKSLKAAEKLQLSGMF